MYELDDFGGLFQLVDTAITKKTTKFKYCQQLLTFVGWLQRKLEDECKLTLATQLPSAELVTLTSDLILNGSPGLMMDYPCGKFGGCSFSRFGSNVWTNTQTHTHTDADECYNLTTFVGVSNEPIMTTAVCTNNKLIEGQFSPFRPSCEQCCRAALQPLHQCTVHYDAGTHRS